MSDKGGPPTFQSKGMSATLYRHLANLHSRWVQEVVSPRAVNLSFASYPLFVSTLTIFLCFLNPFKSSGSKSYIFSPCGRMVQGFYSNLFAVPKPKRGICPIFSFIPTVGHWKDLLLREMSTRALSDNTSLTVQTIQIWILNLQKSFLEPTHHLKYLILTLDLSQTSLLFPWETLHCPVSVKSSVQKPSETLLLHKS